MSRTRLAWMLVASSALVAAWNLRPHLHAADPEPAVVKSPEDMKPTDGAKPFSSSPLTWPPGQVIFEQSDVERKIRDALLQQTEVAFEDTELGEVVEFLEKRHEINIELDTEALAADGKGAETPITKTLRDIPLGKVLQLILDGQGLTYLIKNDVLLITTKAAASQPENLTILLYQVHDLVVAPNDPTASQPDFDSLIEVLTSSIRQTDWHDNGGTIGHITPFQGPGVLAIFVTHDNRGHEEVQHLLRSLRAAKLQVIADAQARQPLKPRPPVGGGMGGGPGLSAVLEQLNPATVIGSPPTAACTGTACPLPKPTGTASEGAKSAPPTQTSGGGFF